MGAHLARGGRLLGIGMVLGSALVWSSGGLIVRSLTLADRWTTIFWRSLAATLFLAALTLFRHRGRSAAVIRRLGWPGLLVAGCFAGSSIALVVSLSLTSVANALVIMSSAPLFAAMLGWVVLREPVRGWTWVAILLSMAGIGLMVSDSRGPGSIAGDLVALGIALGYAGAIVTMRRHRDIGMMPATGLGTLAAMLIALPLATPLHVSATDAWLLALFGAGQLGFGLALFAAGAPLVPAAATALLGTLEPILGPLWVWLAIGEAPGTMALVGGVVVLASLAGNTVLEVVGRR